MIIPPPPPCPLSPSALPVLQVYSETKHKHKKLTATCSIAAHTHTQTRWRPHAGCFLFQGQKTLVPVTMPYCTPAEGKLRANSPVRWFFEVLFSGYVMQARRLTSMWKYCRSGVRFCLTMMEAFAKFVDKLFFGDTNPAHTRSDNAVTTKLLRKILSERTSFWK